MEQNLSTGPSANSSCEGDQCGCGSTRREAIKAVAVGIAAALLPRPADRAMAGPFEKSDFNHLVPADKKLSPQWIQSLTARGTPSVYRGDELKYIGMPIGGITTGQLYLAGDGRLWHWDIFNAPLPRPKDDIHYAHPMAVHSPVKQGFTLSITSDANAAPRSISSEGFSDVSFTGQYPIGLIQYRDQRVPLHISLEAFSPFIPLNVDDSSLPATILQFTLTNTSAAKVEAELTGFLENAVAKSAGKAYQVVRKNSKVTEGNFLLMQCEATGSLVAAAADRPPIVFADFEGNSFDDWLVEGTAFGTKPTRGATADSQHLSGFEGSGLANSLLGGTDQPKGRLTSGEFKIDRQYINFLIGGGQHSKQTCINLLIDQKAVRSQTGNNSDAMSWASWDVAAMSGTMAKIEIVDQSSGAWGHIDIDQIEFSDVPRVPLPEFSQLPDVGTMGLVLLNATASDIGLEKFNSDEVTAITRKISIEPGQTHTATFAVVWCFANLTVKGVKTKQGRHYATRFENSAAVAKYLSANFDWLAAQTRLFRDTWYDSSLPHWLLDRTLLNASILATSTAYRFSDGRFYAWEGVGCCEGTCTHVWQYEQTMGRLFPQLDVLLRERADFNPEISFKPDGMIDHRGEFHAGHAIDGQAGTILRCLRDHQTSVDDAFLKRNWASIKKATQWLISQDGNGDGILEGPQHNTLDAEWFGPVAWLSGMYLASLRAAEEMALDAGDPAFATVCRNIFQPGQKKFVKLLFDGEYFVNKPDPKHRDSINSGSGCEIDQVLGQSWAFQVGLGRVLPESETRSALKSLWRYNFSPDVGPYRQANKPGRWYAMPGEAGLLMCSFPRADWQYDNAKGKGPGFATGYFNECMNGFEHQVAGHMIWEGMVTEGLAIERAVHDRYHPAHRNPWNEIECGDHYARSMASFGVYLAACGFTYHGPKGHLGFAPRVAAENFKGAFVAAAGWGSFSQQLTGTKLSASLAMQWGSLKLNSIYLAVASMPAGSQITIKLGDATLPASFAIEQNVLSIKLNTTVVISSGSIMTIEIG